MSTMIDHTCPIDPGRTDLAREFKADPFGIHSPDLQFVLNRMRSLPIEGKHVLIMTKPHEEWTLAVMEGTPPRPRVMHNYVFHSTAEAEWVVFKLRWKAMTGRELDIE